LTKGPEESLETELLGSKCLLWIFNDDSSTAEFDSCPDGDNSGADDKTFAKLYEEQDPTATADAADAEAMDGGGRAGAIIELGVV
jgi:hypothetical protein